MTIEIKIINNDSRGEAIVKVVNTERDGSSKDKDPRTDYSNTTYLKGGEYATMWVSSETSIAIHEVKNG
jgi:hypothetical protein